jgi:hypothetical protein
MSNPYLPPGAAVSDVTVETEPPPPRPRAAVFTMIVGGLFLALSLYAVARYSFYYARTVHVLGNPQPHFASILLRLAMAAYLFLMVMAIHKRKKFGRWAGALFIASLLLLMVVGSWRAPTAPVPGRLAEFIGYLLGALLVITPFAYWLYAFAFSRKARTWFNWVPGRDAPR